GKYHAFCQPHELAEGPDSAKIAAEAQHAGKNHAFCRPPNEAAALIPRKLPRRPGTLAKTTLFASRMSWLRALTPRKLPAAIFANKSVQLDLHVHARGKLQLHEGVHGLVGRIEDVHEALVGAQLELIPRVLIGVRGDEHGEALHLGRQRDRTPHRGARALGRFDDLASGAVDQAVVEGLEPDTDVLISHFQFTPEPGRASRRPSLSIGKNCLQQFSQKLRPHSLSRASERRGCRWRAIRLLDDLRDDAGADGLATLADRKPQALLHRDRADQLHVDL